MRKWLHDLKILVSVGIAINTIACAKVPVQARLDLPPPPPPSYHGSSYKYLVNDAEFLAIKKFDSLDFPKNLTKKKVQQLLQQFADRVYLRGFRQLGDPDDAGHGHLLLSSNHQEGIVILYHTQEFTGSGYQFDLSKRSWIQWVTSGKTEDAHKYIRKTYPGTPEWNAWKEKFLEANYATGSIDFEMFDPELLGVEIIYTVGNPFVHVEVKDQLQFTFTRVKCEGLSPRTITDANIVEVRVNDNKYCLIINTGAY